MATPSKRAYAIGCVIQGASLSPCPVAGHRYDRNQTLCDYTVELISRFKGLDLVDRVPEELWTEVCSIVQEVVMKTIPKKKIARRQSSCLRKPYS